VRRLRRAGWVAVLAAMLTMGPLPGLPLGAGRAADCPTATADANSSDPSLSALQLTGDNQAMANFGVRPTASPAHAAFIDWLQQQLEAVGGYQVSTDPSLTYTVDRWLEQGATLSAGPDAASIVPMAPSGSVPYGQTTPAGGVTAPLTYVPPGTPLSGQDIAGKIVVRDAVPGSVPYALYSFVEWAHYDPDGSLTTQAATGGVYERDFAGYQQRLDDLSAAGTRGAAGLVFIHGFPRDQVQGQYAPYEGIHWAVPAVYVGADEGARLKTLAASGGVANLGVTASDQLASTRMLVATLPGLSADRIVITSHTDGMNPVWDNGPIAMLALARHFAALPLACRPRTLQFVFTTGHLYQHLVAGSSDRGGSAEVEAKLLDQGYGDGNVAMVFALEHLGAKEYAAVARTDGGPGRRLQPTGRSEVNTFFTGNSPVLVSTIMHAVVARDLGRTYVLQGADAPGPHLPAHETFGGEGTAYHQHLIPTIALVTGPWTLYNPAFGMEALDFDLMRTQTMIFSDMIQSVAGVPTSALGGGYVAERTARDTLCSSGLALMGFVRCRNDPYG
jgi:hypothetical protein